MIRNKLYIAIIIIILLSLSSCVKPGLMVERSYCPEIPQDCNPGTWSRVGNYDTSYSANLNNEYEWKIEQVQGINSPEDEWQLAFIDKNIAILSYNENDLNSPILVRRIKEDVFTIDRGIAGLKDGNNGAFSINNDALALSYSPSVSENISKIEGKYRLAEVEEVIGRSRIYLAEIRNNIIANSELIDMPNLSSMDWISQPAISPNGKIIVFSSDMEGGEGGTDFWLTFKKENDEWSEAINLGQNINSKCDDITPTFSRDGKRLYFSSAGHSTVGGYDLFYSIVQPDLYKDYSNFNSDSDISAYFSSPINLGMPINTIYDEIFPTTSDNFENIIYYSSSQNATNKSLVLAEGGFDIFVCYQAPKYDDKIIAKKEEVKEKIIVKKEQEITFETKIEEPKEEIISTEDEITIKGKVLTRNTNIAVDSALITITKLPEELDNSKSTLTDEEGNFEFPIERNSQYELTAQKSEFFYDSKRIFIGVDYKQDTMDLDFYLPEIGEIRVNFPTDKYKDPYRFTLDSAGIETGRYWKDELKLVAENIKLSLSKIDKIVLVGHTDDVGSDEYNMGLGERRVNFIVDELVKLGIPREIMVARSAGEREPLIQYVNEELNQFRKRLRRVTLEKYFR